MTLNVTTWLNELGLGAYAPAFADNDIDAKTLPQLTAEDLKDIGVSSVGHRRQLLDAIAALAEDAAAAPAERADPAAPSLAAEKRQVTILFADLSGFTKISGDLGAEDTHVLLNRYFEAVDGIVTTNTRSPETP